MYVYMYNRRMDTILAKIPKTIAVSEFRAGLAKHMAAAKKAPIVIADRRGGETFVLLDADLYNEMCEQIEDELAGRTLARLIKENEGKKLIPWEEVRDKHNKRTKK